MNIIGIDPGSITTGFGIITVKNGKLAYVASGCIRLNKLASDAKMHRLHSNMSDILSEYKINHVAIEKVFMCKNPQSAIKLGEARGAIFACIDSKKHRLFQYSPTEVKKNVAGHGHIEKSDLQRVVKQVLNIQGKIQVDAGDGLAIALCHYYQDLYVRLHKR